MKYLAPLLGLCAFSSCAVSDQPTDEGLPPDPEFGYVDGKADAANITEGSDEAIAVLAFVNQDIADDNAGDAFFTLLDSELHKTAARNIANFRAGADGTFGNADDATFSTLQELDAIKYVGRVALMELFGLAKDAGYFNPTSVDCGDTFEAVGGKYHIKTLADLVDLKNSGCTVFNGSLQVQITGVVPSNSKRNLNQIEEVRGNLTVYQNPASFEGLREIHGQLVVTGSFASFPNLEKVGNIDIDADTVKGFDSLLTASRIVVEGADRISGFENLERATILDLTADYVDGFDVLTEVTSLKLQGRYDRETKFKFRKLESATSIDIKFYDRPSNDGYLDFPALVDGGSLKVENVKIGYTKAKFPKLTTLSSLRITNSKNIRLPKLQIVNGTVSINRLEGSGYDWSLPKLVTVNGNFDIENSDDIENLGQLKSISGRLKLWDVCGQIYDMYPFPKLENVGSIDIKPGHQCDVGGFAKVKHVPGSIYLREGRHYFSTTYRNTLQNLETAGTINIFVNDHDDYLPKLETINGSLSIKTDLENMHRLEGFNKLERVEGNLRISGDVRRLPGFDDLTGVGGNIEIDRGINEYERDRFLNQLIDFVGTITLI